MEPGVPRETSPHERRVGLTPFAVAQLAANGHQFYVQSEAGEDCHSPDEDYLAAGASVVYSAEEANRRSGTPGGTPPTPGG